MQHRFISVGIAVAVLLVLGFAALGLIGVAGWLIIRPAEPSQPDRGAPAVLQVTPVTFVIEEAASPAGLVAAAVQQSASVEAQPTATPNSPTPPPTPIPTPSPSPAPAPAGIATRLVIPRLDLDRSVLLSSVRNETWQVDHLGQQIGHLQGTAAPGSSDNIVLAGHVTLEDGSYGPFAQLDKLASGDLVTVYEGDKRYHYIIDDLRVVDRTAIEVVYPSEMGQITLLTCSNWDTAEGRYSDRLVVIGHLLKG